MKIALLVALSVNLDVLKAISKSSGLKYLNIAHPIGVWSEIFYAYALIHLHLHLFLFQY